MGRVREEDKHKWHKHEINEERNGRIYGPYYRISRVEPITNKYVQIYIGKNDFDVDKLNEHFGKFQFIDKQDVIKWMQQQKKVSTS